MARRAIPYEIYIRHSPEKDKTTTHNFHVLSLIQDRRSYNSCSCRLSKMADTIIGPLVQRLFSELHQDPLADTTHGIAEIMRPN